MLAITRICIISGFESPLGRAKCVCDFECAYVCLYDFDGRVVAVHARTHALGDAAGSCLTVRDDSLPHSKVKIPLRLRAHDICTQYYYSTFPFGYLPYKRIFLFQIIQPQIDAVKSLWITINQVLFRWRIHLALFNVLSQSAKAARTFETFQKIKSQNFFSTTAKPVLINI